jgi:hypothetical protein
MLPYFWRKAEKDIALPSAKKTIFLIAFFPRVYTLGY